ncbi:cupin domain-containing protein [Parasphingorhabdus sp. JC815]|uniref:cupin domain-containing protein n=1 Tax=Parasphingorhabdus sp. JC815 TaxID=3232140 RepID=UPI00345A75C0
MALHHAKPNEIVDLAPLGPALTDATTTAITKTDQFEAIRLIVPAGTIIPQHKVDGAITLHCLEGHVELGLDNSSIELTANDWVYLEGGAPHSVKGVKDSSLLLTILFNA